MKNKIFGILSIFALVLLNSCKDKVYNKYLANTPVYMGYDEFRSSLVFETPHELTTKGNIYIKDNYLFISEPNKGIHIIDNTNPSNPNNIGFLKILGNSGLIIKNNYLYANSFIDLVVVDLTNMTNPKEIYRVKDVFPAALPLTKTKHPISTIDKNLGVVIDWDVKEIKEPIDDNVWQNCDLCVNFAINTETNTSNIAWDNSSNNNSNGANSQGISGSITKLTMVGDYLYVMEANQLIPFNISNPIQPIVKNSKSIFRNVETLYAYSNHIFMGTTTGMLIYNLDNPENPILAASVNHMRGCDPVTISGDYAYVTIRSGGTSCSGELNQLDVIDISDIESPKLKKSFQLKNPHGLGADGNLLFVCDGSDGLKLFNATNPLHVGDSLIDEFSNIQATDVIPFNNIAIVIGDDGIYQYDYTNNNNLQLLSTIKF